MNNEEITFNIAVFEYVSGSISGYRFASDTRYRTNCIDTVRISDAMDVKFTIRDKNELIHEVVEKINLEIEKLKEEFLGNKAILETKKLELMALPFDDDKK